MESCNTFIRNLRLSTVLLLCVAGLLLTPPPGAFAQEPEPGQEQAPEPEQVPPPTVSSVAITSIASNGYYKVGETIQATVTFSKNVTGTPTLMLNIGGTGRTAAYTGGSGTATLAFAYTVVSGDADTDGVSIDGLSGSIADDAGNAADLTSATLGAQANHKVDTTVPTVSSVSLTSTPAGNGYYKAGETVQATVTFSENVTGTPTLTLNVGGTSKSAASTSGSGTEFVFGYTVASGDSDTDGISVDGLSGTIADAAGNAADLTNAFLGAQANHKVDTTVPTVSSVSLTSTPAGNGYYKAGETVQATVTFSENVTGTPTLTLNIGGTSKSAASTSGSGTEFVFGYTVVSGDADTDGVSIDGLSGTIADAAGNAADLTNAVLGAQATHKVDTSVPTVSSVSLTSAPAGNGYYKAGETVQATVTFSESVMGTPTLTLNIGGTSKSAASTSGSGTEFVFGYTVVVGDEDTDGVSVDGLSGTVEDAAGNTADLTNAVLGAQASHKVDTTIPTVSSVAITSVAPNGTYKLNETIQATVTFSEVVNVSDRPQLTLNIGGMSKPAAYLSGIGTSQLVFGYTVVSGDEDTDGISVDGLSGTIADAAGNTADLTNATLGAQASHKVDTSVPTVKTDGIAITSAPASNSTYKVGETIQATVTFSETLNVTLPQCHRISLRLSLHS